jgi:ketosteroid isomerase-like protein
MKRIYVALLLFAAVAVPAASAAAQELNDPTLVSAVEAFRKALIDPDKAMLDKLTMAELSYGHSSGLIQDKAAFEEALLSGASDFVSIELSDQTLKVVGNTAWVRHKMSAVTNDGGKPGEAHLSVLLIWMKQKGQWRLLARQAVKIVSQ